MTSVIICLLLSVPVFAESAISASGEKVYFIDNENLCTADERLKVNEALKRVSEKYGMDVTVYDTRYYNGSDIRVYAADKYEELGYQSAPAGGVMLFLATEDRDWVIVETGEAMTAFNSDARDYISEIVVDNYLNNDNFYEAYIRFAELSDEMIGMEQAGTPYKKPFGGLLATAIALFVGVVAGAVYSQSLKSRNKTVRFKAGATDYVRQNSMHVNTSRDFFLYSNVTRTERANSSDSNSGDFSSSSGSSFSGSSGKY